MSHQYPSGTLALKSISVEFEGVGCIALIGANGAGKSTLLRGIVGAQAMSAGHIHLCGEEQYPESGARRHVGYLSERLSLPNELSVHEAIKMAARLRRLGTRPIADSVEWTIERCNLRPLAHRLCDSLSRGQRQRVGLALSIVHRPSILVLDEVHSGLDPLQTVEMNNVLHELAVDHLILLSTHRLEAAAYVARSFWVLDGGSLLSKGPLSEWSDLPAEGLSQPDALRRSYLALIRSRATISLA